jgi:hypothetical protein
MQINADTGCWDWTGSRNNQYGNIFIRWENGRGVMQQAHRASYELLFGEIPDGLVVCHKCDNPKCIRPDHLFVGTPQDNMDDMVAKGRGGSTRGSKNHLAKLNELDIPVIRRMCKDKKLTQQQIGDHFGVTRAAIKAIHLRVTWKHLPERN